MTSGQGDGRDRGPGEPPGGWPPPPGTPGSRPPATPGGGYPGQGTPYPPPGQGPSYPPPPGTHPRQGPPPRGQYPQQGGYPPPGNFGPGPYPPPAGLDPHDQHGVAATSDKNTLSIIAIVLGVIALLILPIVFGPAGIICGVVAMNRKERLAKVGLIVAIAGTVLGFVVGFLFVSAFGGF